MGNCSRFVNHSCDPNMQNYQVWIENLDRRLPRIAFFARRDIKPGEELVFDYKYETGAAKQRLLCYCGAANCRKYMM